MIGMWLTVRNGVSCPFFVAGSCQFFSQNDGRILPIALQTLEDATASCRGVSRWAATTKNQQTAQDATALCRGTSRWLLQRLSTRADGTALCRGTSLLVATKTQ